MHGIAIYLPVWLNASWLDTSKIPYSNLGAANSSLCPRNYSRAFTAWFTWMSVSEGVCCKFWVHADQWGEVSATGKQDRLTGEAVSMRIGVPSVHSNCSSHLSDKCG